MTNIKKEDWLSKFIENTEALCREMDNTGNWLNDNPPPGMSEDDLGLFLNTMSEFGEVILAFGLQVKMCLEDSE